MTQTTTRSVSDVFARDEVRVEGRDKVSGRMKYAADIQLPNMLWAAYTTSPYAYARIRSIDTKAAKAVPGVRAVLTWEDIGKRRCGIQLFDWPVLCYDVVRCIGDRVAAIAAETREAAEEAARRVEVIYEELTPVFDAREALRPDAPTFHPGWNDYYYMAFAGKDKPARSHPNLQVHSVTKKGEENLDPVFAASHRVFEHVFRAPRQHAGYIEPTSTLVWIDEDGLVHVHAANKSPLRLRDQLALVAEIPKESVIVEVNAIGGDFGGKGLGRDVYPAYFLARATGRPVRSIPTYAEELQFGSTRHPAEVTLKTGVDSAGKFTALKVEVLYGGGAYGAVKPAPNLLFGVGFGAAPYQIPSVRIDIICPYTNLPPSGYVRAPGDVQTFFAYEQHVDMIAEALGADPVEFRLRNAMHDGQTTVTNEMIRKPAARAVLETLERELAATPPAPGSVHGVAFFCRHTGIGRASLKLTLSADGTIEVLTGNADQGSGTYTAVQRIIAAELGLELDRVRVRRGNTTEALFDPGIGASRGLHVTGAAAKDCAVKLRAQLEERSGRALDSERFAEIAAQACAAGPLEVRSDYEGMFMGHDNPSDYSIAACAVTLSLDAATGAFRIHDALMVVDVGQIINPIGHQGQIDGGFANGLGSAIMEDMPVDEAGRLQIASLAEYKLPTIADMPPLRTVLVPGFGGHEPYGAKAIGELGNMGVAAAVANAVARAAGVRLTTYPITAERVFEALRART